MLWAIICGLLVVLFIVASNVSSDNGSIIANPTHAPSVVVYALRSIRIAIIARTIIALGTVAALTWIAVNL